MIPDAQPPAEHVSSRYKRLRKIYPELETLSDTQLLGVIDAETRAVWSVPRVIFGLVLAILASGFAVLVFREFARQISLPSPYQTTVIRACLWPLAAFTCAVPWILFVRLVTFQIPHEIRSRLRTQTACSVCGYSLAASPISQDGTTVCPECGSHNVRIRLPTRPAAPSPATMRFQKPGPWMTSSRLWRAIPELDGMPDAECEDIMSAAQADTAMKVTRLALNVAGAAGVLVGVEVFMGVVGRTYYELAQHRTAVVVCAAWLGMVLCSLPAIVMFRIRDLALRKKIRSLLRNGVTPEKQQFASLATPCPAGDAL